MPEGNLSLYLACEITSAGREILAFASLAASPPLPPPTQNHPQTQKHHFKDFTKITIKEINRRDQSSAAENLSSDNDPIASPTEFI